MHSHQDMVFSTAMRLLADDAQAQDVTQEVFLKAYEQFGHLRDSPSRAGWLKTVATNMSLNHLTRYRKRWRLFSDMHREHAGDDDREAALDFPVPDTLLDDLSAGERQRMIEAAISGLPEHQRVPLVLFHFEELSYADIAGRLKVSLAKVKIDILRGRMALAKSLPQARNGQAESVGALR